MQFVDWDKLLPHEKFECHECGKPDVRIKNELTRMIAPAFSMFIVAGVSDIVIKDEFVYWTFVAAAVICSCVSDAGEPSHPFRLCNCLVSTAQSLAARCPNIGKVDSPNCEPGATTRMAAVG